MLTNTRTQHENTRTHHTNTRTYHTNTRTYHTNTRTPHTNTRTPHKNTRTPHTNTRTPHTNTRTPHNLHSRNLCRKRCRQYWCICMSMHVYRCTHVASVQMHHHSIFTDASTLHLYTYTNIASLQEILVHLHVYACVQMHQRCVSTPTLHLCRCTNDAGNVGTPASLPAHTNSHQNIGCARECVAVCCSVL